MPVNQQPYEFPEIDLQFDVTNINVTVTNILKYFKKNAAATNTILLYGEDLSLKLIKLDNRILKADVDYKISIDPTSNLATLAIYNAPAAGSITIKNILTPNTDIHAGGLVDTGDCLIASGTQKLTYSPAVDNLAKYSVKVNLPESGKYSDYQILLNGVNQDSETNNYFIVPVTTTPEEFKICLGDFSNREASYTTSSESPQEINFKTIVLHSLNISAESLDENPETLKAMVNAVRLVDSLGLKLPFTEYNLLGINENILLARNPARTNFMLSNAMDLLGEYQTITNSSAARMAALGSKVIFDSLVKEDTNIASNWLESAFMSKFVGVMHDLKKFIEQRKSIKDKVLTEYQKYTEIPNILVGLIGFDDFKVSLNRYIKLATKQAIVTLDDFIRIVKESVFEPTLELRAALDIFNNWYAVNGMPVLKITENTSRNTITVSQEGEPRPLALQLFSFNANGEQSITEVICYKPTQEFSINFAATTPLLVAPKGSNLAAVEYTTPKTTSQLLTIWRFCTDAHQQQHAAAQIMQQIIKDMLDNPQRKIATDFFDTYKQVLLDSKIDAGAKALILAVPPLTEIFEYRSDIDPLTVQAIRNNFCKQIALECEKELDNIYKTCLSIDNEEADSFSSDSIANRSLLVYCLTILMATEKSEYVGYCRQLCAVPYESFSAQNMTRIEASAKLLVSLADIKYAQYSSDALTIMLESTIFLVVTEPCLETYALCVRPNALHTIKDVLDGKIVNNNSNQQTLLDLNSPRQIKALLSTFVKQNITVFHDKSGKGYEFLVDFIITRLDKLHPDIAAELLGALRQPYARFSDPWRSNIKDALNRILAAPNISQQCKDIANDILSPGIMDHLTTGLAWFGGFFPSMTYTNAVSKKSYADMAKPTPKNRPKKHA